MSCKKMILRLLTVIVGTVIAAFGLDIAIYVDLSYSVLVQHFIPLRTLEKGPMKL